MIFSFTKPNTSKKLIKTKLIISDLQLLNILIKINLTFQILIFHLKFERTKEVNKQNMKQKGRTFKLIFLLNIVLLLTFQFFIVVLKIILGINFFMIVDFIVFKFM